MTDRLDRLQQNYRARFLRYLSRRDELALWSAYELGRESLSGGVSLLDVVQIHHRVLLDVLRDTGGPELPDVAEAATTFLLEVLASFEMTRRGFLDSGADSPRDLPR
jgi:phosphoserine phosphatase RsbU-like protein